MAATLLGHITDADTGSFTTGFTNTTGASLIVIGITEASAGVLTLSDSKGNTWIPLTEQTGTPACMLYYAVPPRTKTGTVHTFSGTGSGMLAVLSAAWFSGIYPTAAFDVQSGASSGSFSTPAQPGSLLPGIADALIVSAFAWATSKVITSVTGMIITDQTNFSSGNFYGGGLAYAVQNGPAVAVNPAWNYSGTVAGSVVAATFVPSWGGSLADTPFAQP